MILKLIFVVILTIYHFYLGRILGQFKLDVNTHSHKFYRFINEIPEERVEKNEISLSENDDFEFNQDNSIEFDEEYRSPGWDRYKKNKILK